MMEPKFCFVIMGFGKKTDFISSRSIDLDKTYLKIIKPSVEQSGYICVRADEINDSGLIDKTMYALLIQSDLVIADISTYNPNALYELGIRHAVKPFSTIIIKESELAKIPFDIDHTRMFTYTHSGDEISEEESNRCINQLKLLIDNASRNKNADSPLYEHISSVVPPILPKDVFEQIIGDLAKKERHLFALVQSAQSNVSNSDFISATKNWKKALEINPNDEYYIQQLALSTYKSKSPSQSVALTDALTIINSILPSNNPETLGISGAINKNLFLSTGDIEFINRAIDNYNKGYTLTLNYYTGENYATCLNLKAKASNNPDEYRALNYLAKDTRKKILKNLEDIIQSEDFENIEDKKWIYASLAHCYKSEGLIEKQVEFEQLFMTNAVEWEKETYRKGLDLASL